MDADFREQTLQNWQSEFLAVGRATTDVSGESTTVFVAAAERG